MTTCTGVTFFGWGGGEKEQMRPQYFFLSKKRFFGYRVEEGKVKKKEKVGEVVFVC